MHTAQPPSTVEANMQTAILKLDIPSEHKQVGTQTTGSNPSALVREAHMIKLK